MKKVNIACVIDDDPIFVFGVKKVMDMVDFCHRLLVFSNGQEALDNFKNMISSNSDFPDVILLDLNMPILDGWQFLEQFTQIPFCKKFTLYIASSSVDPEDTLRAESYEIVKDYINKPISLNKLKTILNELKNAG